MCVVDLGELFVNLATAMNCSEPFCFCDCSPGTAQLGGQVPQLQHAAGTTTLCALHSSAGRGTAAATAAKQKPAQTCTLDLWIDEETNEHPCTHACTCHNPTQRHAATHNCCQQPRKAPSANHNSGSCADGKPSGGKVRCRAVPAPAVCSLSRASAAAVAPAGLLVLLLWPQQSVSDEGAH